MDISHSRSIMIFTLATVLASTLAAAQTVTKGQVVQKKNGTVEEIDSTNRIATIKWTDGTEDSVSAGREVKRFDELKVGDKVAVTYYESTVYQIRKPGEASAPPSGNLSATPTSGTLPRGGTIASQTTMTVTVKAIDMSAPSITVTKADGSTVVRKVDDKSKLNGVKVGDRIDITQTQAAVVSVEPAK